MTMLTSLQTAIKSRNKPSSLIIILGLVTTVAILLFLASEFDASKSLSSWQNLRIDSLTLCFLLILLSHIARGGRIYHHFLPHTEGRFDLCLRIALHHNFYNYLVPMRVGEASFPILLRQSFSIDLTESTAALVSFRLLDLLTLALIGILTLVLGMHLAGHLQLLLVALLTVAVIGLLLPNLFHQLTKHWPNLKNPINKFKQGIPRKPSDILRLSLWTLMVWAIKLTAYTLIIGSFVNISFSLSLASAVSGELASGIPLYTPAAIGTFEGGIAAVLLPAGIDQTSAITAAVNLHLFLLITTSLSAGFGLLIGNRKNVAR
ncbi:MAG: lysylphosphatidylglycerol synthase transmembrane domain-containing protein [Candidatus Thiodiazotropha sp. 6PLUC9]